MTEKTTYSLFLLTLLLIASVNIPTVHAQDFVGWAGAYISGIHCDTDNQRSIDYTCTAATCTGLFLGTSDGQFRFPRGVAVDDSGNVYIADTVTHRVQKFDIRGNFVGWAGKCTGGDFCDTVNQKSIGFNCDAATCMGLGPGSGDGQFAGPQAIAIGPSEFIDEIHTYIVDTANHRIQLFRCELLGCGEDEEQKSSHLD